MEASYRIHSKKEKEDLNMEAGSQRQGGTAVLGWRQAPGVTARKRFELRAGDKESPSMDRFREVSIIFFTQIVPVSQVKTSLSSGQSCHRRLHLVLLYSSLRRRPCILYVPLQLISPCHFMSRPFVFYSLFPCQNFPDIN